MMGWCIVIKKTALDKIIPFDEQFDMYYQDNDYAKMIESKGIKHALVRHSIVTHLNTASIVKLDKAKMNKMQTDKIKFENKWK
jgi:GT2 family glycosyltransferase